VKPQPERTVFRMPPAPVAETLRPAPSRRVCHRRGSRIQAAPSTGEYSACAGAARCGIEPAPRRDRRRVRRALPRRNRRPNRRTWLRPRAEPKPRPRRRALRHRWRRSGQPRRPVDDRALGLKLGRVVLDPGHGGKMPERSARAGLEEKALVLDVAQRLGVLITQRLGSE